jgi:hypothetical protein
VCGDDGAYKIEINKKAFNSVPGRLWGIVSLRHADVVILPFSAE